MIRAKKSLGQNFLTDKNILEKIVNIVPIECFQREVEPGVYNMTNSGSITTRQVTDWMVEEGVTHKEFKFFENENHFMENAVRTPRSNCVLDTSKAQKAGIGMRPVEEAIRDSLRKMVREVSV